MNGENTEKLDNHKSETNRGGPESSSQQGWVIVGYSNSDNENTQGVAEKSPQLEQAPKNEPTTTSLSPGSAQYQQVLQHLGAWSQIQIDYPPSIESSTPEDFTSYPIERYQEQKPKEDPWSTVTYYQK